MTHLHHKGAQSILGQFKNTSTPAEKEVPSRKQWIANFKTVTSHIQYSFNYCMYSESTIIFLLELVNTEESCFQCTKKYFQFMDCST